MKVLFLSRINALTEFGGDTMQAKIYKFYLEKNLDIKIFFGDEIVNDEYFDVLHVFNIDLIHEIFFQIQEKNISFGKVNITPIHHSYMHIKEFFRKSDHLDFFSKIFGMSYHFKMILKLIPKVTYRTSSLLLISRSNLIKRLIGICNCIIFVGEEEKKWFEEDFQIPISNEKLILMGNGAKVVIHKKKISERKFDILLVGRIEARKRTVENIELIISNFPDLKIAVCGAFNERNTKNKLKFTKLLNNYPNITYFGHLTEEELSLVYLDSKIVCGVSSFEVAPINEVESINHGCFYIGTSKSAIRFRDTNTVVYVNPYDESEILKGYNNLLKLLNCDDDKLKYPPNQSWNELLQPLIFLYQNIIEPRLED